MLKKAAGNEYRKPHYLLPGLDNFFLLAVLNRIIITMKKKVINSSIFAAVCIFLSGCAASYKPLNPETASYIKDNGGVANVQLEYHHNLLAEKKNKKHHKKELKKGSQIIALKITNNTEADLEYNKNFQLYSNGAVLNVLPTQTTHSQLKQQAALFIASLVDVHYCYY